MANLVSFTPLMRSSIGFDRFNDIFDALVEGKGGEHFDAYPPYNIEKEGEDKYRIVMAVAGFTMNDLNIMAQGDSLTVSGQIAEKAEKGDTAWLHRGIATRAFQRSFRLADHIKVMGAELHDGLLTVHLVHEVPEEAKPRMVPINGTAPQVEGKDAKKVH